MDENSLDDKERELASLLVPNERGNAKKIRAKLCEALRRYAETLEALPQRPQSK